MTVTLFSTFRFVSFLLRYAHDKSLDETKVFTPEDIETMLFDQIAKLAVQIFKPEAAIDNGPSSHALHQSHILPQWAPSPVLVSPPLGSRGIGGSGRYGPVPDSVEV